ncbi:hypothetical protein B0H11DRAFT_1939749 [Mycena galericulata]|nr:hypothetical protein B0H11DRAFT_1939749 [Mycena galericulata]
MHKDALLSWMDKKIQDLPHSSHYPHNTSPTSTPITDAKDDLYGPSHLKYLLQRGSDVDVALIWHHPAPDPQHSFEEWTLPCGNLTPNSVLGYAFPADLSAHYNWDTSVFGNDGLDYILTVKLSTLRKVRQKLFASQTKESLHVLLFKEDRLSQWLQTHNIQGEDALRLFAIVQRTAPFRDSPPNAAYRGRNARLAGGSVPPAFVQ